MAKSMFQLTDTESEGGRMLMKAQIQFTEYQIEQLDELRRQTGATRTVLVRRAVEILHARTPGAWSQEGLAFFSY